MNWIIITKKNDTLTHYGVKGMKWGVRKQIVSSNNRPMRPKTYQERDEELAKRVRSNSKKPSSRVVRKAAKDYKKQYDSKSTELYIKNGKNLEKYVRTNSEKYYQTVDSIQDAASAHARNYIKQRYGLTVSDINSKKKRIPNYMNTNIG